MPVAERLIRCPACGGVRLYHARGLCRTCYNRRHALGNRPCAACGKPTASRGGRCGPCRGAVPRAARLAAPASPRLVVRRGLVLSAAPDADADARERARRVEVYRRQVEATGRLDFAAPDLRQGSAPREAS